MHRSQSTPSMKSPKGGLDGNHNSSVMSLGAQTSATNQTMGSWNDEGEYIPGGVTRIYGKRMQMDAKGSPAFLHMRMNYRNMLNEYNLHGGKLVSNQYALMKPRLRASLGKPKELEPPPGVNIATWKKVSRLRAKKAAEEAARIANEARTARAGSAGGYGNASDGEDGEDANDPTHKKSVLDVTRNQSVQDVFGAMEDPPGSGNGIDPNRITRALEALNFSGPDSAKIEEALKSLVFRAKPDMPLQLDEFGVIVDSFQIEREKSMRAHFDRLDSDGSGSIDLYELRRLLWDMGFTVSREAVEEILNEVDTDKSGTVELPEFEACLRVIYERFGFTKQEATKMLELFDNYDDDKSGLMSADELASAMGYFGHPMSIEGAKDIMDRHLDTDSYNITKPEFLRVLRSVKEEELEEFRTIFSTIDEDQSGSLDMSELLSLFLGIGYTIQQSVIEEGVKEIGKGTGLTSLVFEDCVLLLEKLRKKEGFSTSEVTELEEVFNKFCSAGRDHLREFEVARVLNWLGYPLTQQRRRQYWVQVDVDKSGVIDFGEFLKLVRLLREEETNSARNLLDKPGAFVGEEQSLSQNELKALLQKLGYEPAAEVITKALEQTTDSTGDGTADILGVLSVIRFLRESQVARLRDSAGLSDDQVNKIKRKFKKSLEDNGKVSADDFEKFMHEMFKSAKGSRGATDTITKFIEEHLVDGGLGLQEMFWVVRLYDDTRAEEAWQRETEAVKKTGFTSAKVAEYRKQFMAADVDGSGTLSDSEILEVFDTMIQIDMDQAELLQEEFALLDETKDAIDFPEFLRLLGVILRR
eukprot:TRINITY_DN21269_c0_g1_i1.p1 TRINITY_DN21269_c0_g1~~TRINITY_DN21269_c0_g1_i1.p1  ORF type:complete len:811 (-),score=205.56 TRINITY_DN21269_c0_g1_i1:202-2634(-)